jgi:enoyl-CoA hydratase/carnithine racemase
MTESLVGLTVEDHIATVMLNRSDALNAISGAMADELTTALQEVAANRDVWVVIVAAAGDKAFCVGADLKERNGFTLEQFHENRKQIRGLFAALRSMPQPVVASIFGFALGGGCEIALSCDIVVAAQGTQLGLPETRVGLLPAGGGTQLLTRKVGTSRAKDLIFRGKRIDAGFAQQLGLVAEVCEREELQNFTLEVARDICKSSPVAVAAAKRSIDGGLGMPIDDGIELENEMWKTVIASSDRQEGIEAFNDKRPPNWSNS